MKNQFWFNLLTGVILIILTIVIIPKLAGFDDQPEFVWLFASLFVIIGIVSFIVGYLKKR